MIQSRKITIGEWKAKVLHNIDASTDTEESGFREKYASDATTIKKMVKIHEEKVKL